MSKTVTSQNPEFDRRTQLNLQYVSERYFAKAPRTLHEKAVHLIPELQGDRLASQRWEEVDRNLSSENVRETQSLTVSHDGESGVSTGLVVVSVAESPMPIRSSRRWIVGA